MTTADSFNSPKQTLKQYFGENFPLEKETQEKNKVEEQSNLKQYGVIKEKVMNELLKFFFRKIMALQVIVANQV